MSSAPPVIFICLAVIIVRILPKCWSKKRRNPNFNFNKISLKICNFISQIFFFSSGWFVLLVKSNSVLYLIIFCLIPSLSTFVLWQMKRGEKYSSEMSKVGFQTRPISNSVLTSKFTLNKKSENASPNMPLFLVVFKRLFTLASLTAFFFFFLPACLFQTLSAFCSCFRLWPTQLECQKHCILVKPRRKMEGKGLASGGVEQRKRKKKKPCGLMSECETIRATGRECRVG